MSAMASSVLIVDDHPGFRATARRLLESEGYVVVGEAEDGAAALAAVGDLRPDVVLPARDGGAGAVAVSRGGLRARSRP
jgi:DNA-binding NarL/FixJ family response regulator